MFFRYLLLIPRIVFSTPYINKSVTISNFWISESGRLCCLEKLSDIFQPTTNKSFKFAKHSIKKYFVNVMAVGPEFKNKKGRILSLLSSTQNQIIVSNQMSQNPEWMNGHSIGILGENDELSCSLMIDRYNAPKEIVISLTPYGGHFSSIETFLIIFTKTEITNEISESSLLENLLMVASNSDKVFGPSLSKEPENNGTALDLTSDTEGSLVHDLQGENTEDDKSVKNAETPKIDLNDDETEDKPFYKKLPKYAIYGAIGVGSLLILAMILNNYYFKSNEDSSSKLEEI